MSRSAPVLRDTEVMSGTNSKMAEQLMAAMRQLRHEQATLAKELADREPQVAEKQRDLAVRLERLIPVFDSLLS